MITVQVFQALPLHLRYKYPTFTHTSQSRLTSPPCTHKKKKPLWNGKIKKSKEKIEVSATFALNFSFHFWFCSFENFLN